MEGRLPAVALAAIVLATGGFAVAGVRHALPGTKLGAPPSAPDLEAVVRVDGAVRRPGVYAIGDGTVGALVARAGGPARGELPTDLSRRTVRVADRVTVVSSASRDASPCVRVGRMPGREGLVYGIPLDINAADAADFDALTGIGPALAARIVADRDAHGPFERVEDLRRVKGIGPAGLASWSGRLAVSSSRPRPWLPALSCGP